MKKRQPVIAVFDIGKTNKKLLVFDTDYQVVFEETTAFIEEADEDGFPCENIDELTTWMLRHVEILKHSDIYQLKAINFSTYGASQLYLDEQGKRLTPLYNYLKPYPKELLNRFYTTHGDEEKIAVETSSPMMGYLNPGLQLYWLKHQKPALFEKLSSVLHFPQYLSYQLTGKKTAEMTYVGSHSAMWNFRNKSYHSWLKEEGLQAKLLPVVSGKQAYTVNDDYTSDEIAVGIGLHDSSAAIIPYLMSFTEPFVIVSTGTWTITLNPFSKELPSLQELKNGCLSYLTYEGDPVKVSMLFAGHDHDQQLERIAAHFNMQPDYFKGLRYDQQWIDTIRSETEDETLIHKKHQVDAATGSCVFHLRELVAFKSAEHAYHRLTLDIIERQAIVTQMAMNNSQVKNMYVDGGFCKNDIYMRLLSDAFPAMQVYSSSMVQGTALGAALAIHHAWNTNPLPAHLIHLRHWPRKQTL